MSPPRRSWASTRGGWSPWRTSTGCARDVDPGLPAEPHDADDIHAAVRVAREEGIEDLWTWGFEACGHMSALGGSDPAAVWEGRGWGGGGAGAGGSVPGVGR